MLKRTDVKYYKTLTYRRLQNSNLQQEKYFYESNSLDYRYY